MSHGRRGRSGRARASRCPSATSCGSAGCSPRPSRHVAGWLGAAPAAARARGAARPWAHELETDPSPALLSTSTWPRSTRARTRSCCPPRARASAARGRGARLRTPVVAFDAPALREVLGERATSCAAETSRACCRPRTPPAAGAGAVGLELAGRGERELERLPRALEAPRRAALDPRAAQPGGHTLRRRGGPMQRAGRGRRARAR